MQNYMLSYTAITTCATSAQQLYVALAAQITQAYTIKFTTHANNCYYFVQVQRMFTCYNSAVNVFNSTVEQFCNTVSKHIDTEEWPVTCYVFDDEGYACY